MRKCRSAEIGEGVGLRALALVWGALALGTAARARIGADAAVLLAFGLALLALRVTRPPAAGRGDRARALVAAAVGLAAGFASLPAWWGACLAWVLALGLAPGPPAVPGAGSPAILAAAVVLAPVLEETLYRERLLGVLAARLRLVPALVLSSGLFALPHARPALVAATFLVGLGLGALRLASGSLALCIGVHAGLNLAVFACGAPPRRAALDPAAAALVGAGILVPATWGLRRAAWRRARAPG